MNMKIRDNNVLIIDAMNLIHRSFYAYPRLTTKDGVPTGAFFEVFRYSCCIYKSRDCRYS